MLYRNHNTLKISNEFIMKPFYHITEVFSLSFTLQYLLVGGEIGSSQHGHNGRLQCLNLYDV